MRLPPLLFALSLLAPLASGAQENAARFRINVVGDTTFSFVSGPTQWIKAGLVGSAVDPRRRDTLVARFRILSVGNGEATAVITGQTTAVTTDHMALLVAPRKSWARGPTFWVGLLLGTALGFGIGASASP